MAFLTAAGVPLPQARTAMLTASRYTVGCALEEQAEAAMDDEPRTAGAPSTDDRIDHGSAFEAGLALILQGLLASIEH